MLGGNSGIVANFSSPPFSNIQLKDPKIRAILNSDDILGGPISFNVMATTAKFRNDNPKLYGAFLSALREATEMVSKDQEAAAETYLRLTKDRSSKEELVAILGDKTTQITTDVLNLGSFTDFMGKVGRLKNAPVDWVPMEFVLASIEPLGVGARAPNPNSARLFVDFLLSKEAQTLMRDRSRIPSRPDVPPDPPELTRGLKIIPTDVSLANESKQLAKEFDDIFKQGK